MSRKLKIPQLPGVTKGVTKAKREGARWSGMEQETVMRNASLYALYESLSLPVLLGHTSHFGIPNPGAVRSNRAGGIVFSMTYVPFSFLL